MYQIKFTNKDKMGDRIVLTLLAKIILVATSLAPVCFVLAFNYIGKCFWKTGALIAAVIGLYLIGKIMMNYISRTGEPFRLHIKEFNRKDQGTLTFLLIYILPVISHPDASFSAEWYMILAVFFIIVLTIVDVGAYNCNLLIRFCGYSFFEVRDKDGLPCLLLTKKKHLNPDEEIMMTEISRDVFVQTEYNNV